MLLFGYLCLCSQQFLLSDVTTSSSSLTVVGVGGDKGGHVEDEVDDQFHGDFEITLIGIEKVKIRYKNTSRKA